MDHSTFSNFLPTEATKKWANEVEVYSPRPTTIENILNYSKALQVKKAGPIECQVLLN